MKFKIYTICLILFNISFFNLSAQTVEKVVDFKYVTSKNLVARKPEFGMSSEPTRPFLMNMQLLNDTIVLNSFLVISGTINEKGARAGTSVAGFEAFSGGSSANLITENTFDLQLNQTSQNEAVVTNTNVVPKKPIEFNEGAIGKTYNKYNLKSVDQFAIKNTALLIKPEFPFELVQEGRGIVKIKDANLVLNKFNYSLKVSGYGKFDKSDAMVPLNVAEWKTKTKNLYLTVNSKVSTKLSDNVYIALVNRINSDDNYWGTKNYAFIIFDSNGQIKKIHQVDFEFIRQFNSQTRVFNTSGVQQGILISFKNDTEMTGQKKRKDPIRNKFNLFYFTNDGELKMKVDLIHGEDPEKDDYFNPSIAVEKDDQLLLINKYIQYGFKKNVEYFERLVINKTGKASGESFAATTKLGKGLSHLNLSFYNPVFHNGAFYSSFTQMSKNAEGVPNYTNSIVSKINADLTSPEVSLVFNKQPQKDPVINTLVKTENNIYSVISYADGNQVLNLEGGAKPLDIIYSTCFQPLSSYLLKNFVVDKNAKNIYLVLEGAKAGEAKLVKVGL
jgi:hypothetical protein